MLLEATPSPFTTDEECALFHAFLTHGLSHSHLSAAINDPRLSLQDVLLWMKLPHVRDLFDEYQRVEALAKSLATEKAAIAAIKSLEQICTHDPDSTNRRRAATTLLHPPRPRVTKPDAPTNPAPPNTPAPAAPTPPDEPPQAPRIQQLQDTLNDQFDAPTTQRVSGAQAHEVDPSDSLAPADPADPPASSAPSAPSATAAVPGTVASHRDDHGPPHPT